MSGLVWVELVFMMLILKLPIVYLVAVVWWAIRAEPRPPLEGAALPVPPAWSPRPRDPRHGRPRRSGPRGRRGGPVRTYARRAATARARLGR